MKQDYFILANFNSLSTRFLNKIDRCGVKYWELYTYAEKQIAISRRGCYNCALKRKEDGFCFPAGKKVDELPVL